MPRVNIIGQTTEGYTVEWLPLTGRPQPTETEATDAGILALRCAEGMNISVDIEVAPDGGKLTLTFENEADARALANRYEMQLFAEACKLENPERPEATLVPATI